MSTSGGASIETQVYLSLNVSCCPLVYLLQAWGSCFVHLLFIPQTHRTPLGLTSRKQHTGVVIALPFTL